MENEVKTETGILEGIIGDAVHYTVRSVSGLSLSDLERRLADAIEFAQEHRARATGNDDPVAYLTACRWSLHMAAEAVAMHMLLDGRAGLTVKDDIHAVVDAVSYRMFEIYHGFVQRPENATPGIGLRM